MDEDAVYAAAGAVSGLSVVISLVICVLLIVAMWKVFEKAGEAGWKSIVPFLNMYTMFKIAMGNGWLFLLSFVPCANVVVGLICMWKLNKAFGQGVGMFLVMLFFTPIAWLMLGFGSAQYQGVQ